MFVVIDKTDESTDAFGPFMSERAARDFASQYIQSWFLDWADVTIAKLYPGDESVMDKSNGLQGD